MMLPLWWLVAGLGALALILVVLWLRARRHALSSQQQLDSQALWQRVQNQLHEQAETGLICLTSELDISFVSPSLNALFENSTTVTGRHVTALKLDWPLSALRSWRDGKSAYFDQRVPGFRLVGYRRDGKLWLQVIREKALARMRQQLRLDGVTGLHNREGFILRLAEQDCSAKVLAQLNLSRFRLVNDNLGLEAGDALLRALGDSIKGALHHGEFAARPDGDTFWLLLNGDDDKWQPRLEALIRVLHDAINLAGHEGLPITIKAGVSDCDSDLSAWEWLRRADLACHLPSDLPWVRFSADHPLLLERHQASHWAQKVSEAIHNDGFQLYFQPLKALKPHTGPMRVEVLVRMLGEHGELVSPGRFLGATEYFQLTSRLDRWVIKSVIRWLSRHPELHDQLILAVNLSGESLSDSRFALLIRRWLRDAGVPPRMLCIEITESVAIHNLREAKRFMATLQEAGVRFALDDFGSGFSSFRYLQVLPVDYVKIDGSLVQDLLSSRRDRTIVRGIVSVCRVLGLPVVAEYVDKPQLLEYIRRIGLDYAQGNLIGRPSRLDLLPLELQHQQEEGAISDGVEGS